MKFFMHERSEILALQTSTLTGTRSMLLHLLFLALWISTVVNFRIANESKQQSLLIFRGRTSLSSLQASNSMSRKILQSFQNIAVPKEAADVLEHGSTVQKIHLIDFYLAVTAYKNNHGVFSRPAKTFVVPRTSAYPASTWDMNLGVLFEAVRIYKRQKASESKQNSEEEADNCFVETKSTAETVRTLWRMIETKLAHVQYIKIYGSKPTIPFNYTIPMNDTRFPEPLRGLELGRDVTNMALYAQRRSIRPYLDEFGTEFS